MRANIEGPRCQVRPRRVGKHPDEHGGNDEGRAAVVHHRSSVLRWSVQDPKKLPQSRVSFGLPGMLAQDCKEGRPPSSGLPDFPIPTAWP